jgi:uncharacterized repeat protein (TIGR03803 family)
VQVGGEFYGTTPSGGASNFGTLYEISPAGDFKSIYSFCRKSANCSDGAYPGNYLTRGPSGDVYGVTAVGGGRYDGGTIFKLTSGRLSTVYNFCSRSNCADGTAPVAVAFDAGGALFGTTSAGGKNGAGTAFKIAVSGAVETLYNFCSADNCADGITPGALILAKDGVFYGTTAAGGSYQAGTVFRMTPTGILTVLHSFCPRKGCADGEAPTPILAQGSDGNLYGTTVLGGDKGLGAIFRVSRSGRFEVLHSFCRNTYCYDGSTPSDGLTAVKDGGFYGTTSLGGRFYAGIVFRFTTAGAYTIVQEFCGRPGCFDGAAPIAAPIVGRDGALYGTTSAGGDKFDVGSIYRLVP